ncbi:alpha-2-macroglobulin family protein [bacterium]|nr:alpha-2-macroglobulin family protein [bacterium]
MARRPSKKKSLKTVIRYLFGSVSYEPPGFWKALGTAAGKAARPLRRGTEGVRKRHPGLYRSMRNALRAVLIIAAAYLLWRAVRPPASGISVSVEIPPPMIMEENAKPFPLVLTFSGSAAPLDRVGREVSDGVRIRPQGAGTWLWEDDDRIAFAPVQDWLPGTRYTVTFEERAINSSVSLASSRISFSTEPFTATVVSGDFVVDPRDESRKQVTATIRFSHPVDTAGFRKRITLKPLETAEDERAFENRRYRFSLEYDSFLTAAYLVSEPLPVPEHDVIMELRIDTGTGALLGGEPLKDPVSYQVAVPGADTFARISSLEQTYVQNSDDRYEQVLVVETDGRVRSEDLGAHLEVYLLPNDLPALPGQKPQENYYWSNPAMVGPEVLALSKRVDVEPLPSEHEFSSVNSFRISGDPGRFIYVKISVGTPFYGQYRLAEPYDRIIRIAPFPRQLEIMYEGALLSSRAPGVISIMEQGLSGVMYRVGRVKPGAISHLVSQTNGRLDEIMFNTYSFSEDNIVENFWLTQRLRSGEPGEPVYFSFDLDDYLVQERAGGPRWGVFFFEVREWDPENNRTGSAYDKRLLIISDLGIIVKNNADGSHDLFVQSISRGEPVAGAAIALVGKNGSTVLTVESDAGGHASMPAFDGLYRERAPVAYLVTHGQDVSFMPVSAPGRWLDYSSYDVGGTWGTADPKRMRAFLFSDRGMYRPGDPFHIGMAVKSGDWNSGAVAGTPLEAVVIDSRGLEIYKKKFRLDRTGFEELTYTTERTSPTGTYQVDLYTIKDEERYTVIGSTVLQVEEFQPDRLTVSCRFPDISDKGWVSPEHLKGLVQVYTLFGTAASGNRVKGTLTLEPGLLRFDAYSGYRFADPREPGDAYTETLPEKRTDGSGQAVFDFGLERFSPATYRLRFSAEAFEESGGRSVYGEASLLVSPLAWIVGYRADGDLEYIARQARRTISFIALDSDLERVDAGTIQAELDEIKHVSVLTREPGGTYVYKSTPRRVAVSRSMLRIPAAGYDYQLPTDTPGEYELTLKNSEGTAVCTVHFSVTGTENLTRSLDQTAELEIKLDRQDYLPGDEIELYIKAPYPGAGLITIERDKVFAYKWFSSARTAFTEKIRIPAGLEGNGYVTVAFVRAPDSDDIFMSPLSYGVADFSISLESRVNRLTVEFPKEVRSGGSVPVSYRSSSPGKIILFAVDEGILRAAGYESPDPLAFFFTKGALEVRTAQILDLILPDITVQRRVQAAGGGIWDEEGAARFLNPFQRKHQDPVIFWSGIREVDARRRTLSVPVPDYFNGTLRIMAVAVSEERLGSYSGRTIANNPYIITPHPPLFAAPGDSFIVPVSVTNMLGSGPAAGVTLRVTSSDNLVPLRDQFDLSPAYQADTTLYLGVRALDTPGDAHLFFSAEGGGETVTLASHLSVRPARHFMTTLSAGMIRSGSKEVRIDRSLYDEQRLLEASVSFLPLGMAAGLTHYLDSYPYGCSEQIISQSFPYLVLSGISGLGVSAEKTEESVKEALTILQARQNSRGMIGVWAANAHTSDFITAYAMDFVTACREREWYVPDQFYYSGIRALREIAAGESGDDDRVRAYAIYLLTRNELITTNYIASLTESLDGVGTDEWKSSITGGYLAASYALMRQDEKAAELISRAVKGTLKQKHDRYYNSAFVQTAEMVSLIADHFPDRIGDLAPLIDYIRQELEDGWYSTINASYALRALSRYAALMDVPSEGEAVIHQVLADGSRQLLNLPAADIAAAPFSPDAETIVIGNHSSVPLYYQVSVAGFDRAMPKKSLFKGVEIFREYRDASGRLLKHAVLGDDIYVTLRLRSLEDRPLYDVAVVDLFPAGLEPVIDAVRESGEGSWQPDQVDLREDRLIIAGTVTGRVCEFSYRMKAVNSGLFTVPPVYCEAMYEPTIYAYQIQNKLEIHPR